MTRQTSRRSSSRPDSFRHAFAGWWHVLRSQRNAWIHALATLLVVGLGAFLGLDRLGWGLILVAISLVWLAEFFNTALEDALRLMGNDADLAGRNGLAGRSD